MYMRRAMSIRDVNSLVWNPGFGTSSYIDSNSERGTQEGWLGSGNKRMKMK